MDSEKIPVAAVAPADEGPSIVAAAPKQQAKVTASRALTRDEIRNLQLSLKEIDLDPGPADGVAGPRTRAAYLRLQDGCSKIKTLIENSAEADPLVPKKILTKQETLLIQTQLRGAGFNPGPVDGVFGNRTRSVLLRLKDDCPKVEDFAGVLDSAAVQASVSIFSTPQNMSAPVRDAIKRTALSQAAQSRDETRILQLRLRDAGFDPGPFDGVMGPKTRLALQQYETSQRSKKTKISVTTNSINGQY
jgi:peptidoglycan hydrolase-like protein with peptidoglycan-binding domain